MGNLAASLEQEAQLLAYIVVVPSSQQLSMVGVISLDCTVQSKTSYSFLGVVHPGSRYSPPVSTAPDPCL